MSVGEWLHTDAFPVFRASRTYETSLTVRFVVEVNSSSGVNEIINSVLTSTRPHPVSVYYETESHEMSLILYFSCCCLI